MKKALVSLILVALASFMAASLSSTSAQNRERFVISAHAGGVNAVTGRAAMRAHGNTDWQQLTTKEDLETGDVVRTGLDGRVEVLLNPGSYLRMGEDSELELTNNSFENLEVRLTRGTAIVEVTGADDSELLINISTPHTRMAIVRRGLYRVNVVPGDATELIVRKGRVMLQPTHTKIKGGNKVVFNENSFSVAKLRNADKTKDSIEVWSKDRAQTLARANSRLNPQIVYSLVSAYGSNGWIANSVARGVWLYEAGGRCFTFYPFSIGWDSPYGLAYMSSYYYGSVHCCNRIPGLGNYPASGTPVNAGNGNGNGSGAGYGGGNGGGNGGGPPSPPPVAPSSPISQPAAQRDTTGPASSHRPDNP